MLTPPKLEKVSISMFTVPSLTRPWCLILTLETWILENFMFSSCVKVHTQLTVKSLITFLTIVYLLTWMFIYFEFLQISLIWYEILTLVTYIYSDTFMFGYFVFLRFCLLEVRYSHWSHEDWTPSCLVSLCSFRLSCLAPWYSHWLQEYIVPFNF